MLWILCHFHTFSPSQRQKLNFFSITFISSDTFSLLSNENHVSPNLMWMFCDEWQDQKLLYLSVKKNVKSFLDQLENVKKLKTELYFWVHGKLTFLEINGLWLEIQTWWWQTMVHCCRLRWISDFNCSGVFSHCGISAFTLRPEYLNTSSVADIK